MFPESKRWPVPSFTVICCDLTDPVVEVDQHTQFLYRETREGGSTFFFSPHRNERLLSAEVRCAILSSGDQMIDIAEDSVDEDEEENEPASTPFFEPPDTLYLGIDFEGETNDFDGSQLFLLGNPEALKQLYWSSWSPGTESGLFHDENAFCPGMVSRANERSYVYHDLPTDWGGLRSSADLFSPIHDNFVFLSTEFVSAWEKASLDDDLADIMSSNGIDLPEDNSPLYWIKIDLPDGGDRARFNSPLGFHFNSFIATNKSEQTLFKHTGGNPFVEIEIPEDISNLLEISNVVDSNSNEYLPVHTVQTGSDTRSYAADERDGKPLLWLDFSPYMEVPPDSITVYYSVTAATRANGIEAGKINELYENHPGITGAENIIPASGAIPAKTEEQIVTEAKTRLRDRDRALSFQEISRWARTFDPRIIDAACENSTELTSRGVRRCIAVLLSIEHQAFYSNDEISLLQRRLTSFLKSRVPVNTHFKVGIKKK